MPPLLPALYLSKFYPSLQHLLKCHNLHKAFPDLSSPAVLIGTQAGIFHGPETVLGAQITTPPPPKKGKKKEKLFKRTKQKC
ncbi:hypothetical protein PAL_GLEAN10009522 [Pteropus alecto]|uniref:Uncharacterized protein n=1 Tax=Pteropus alecto TaxID=9402 RepID=L5L4D2_PTEAL|nr:hypothetical protein PAL_GLEAN10009522 [Pteropus alecto]